MVKSITYSRKLRTRVVGYGMDFLQTHQNPCIFHGLTSSLRACRAVSIAFVKTSTRRLDGPGRGRILFCTSISKSATNLLVHPIRVQSRYLLPLPIYKFFGIAYVIVTTVVTNLCPFGTFVRRHNDDPVRCNEPAYWCRADRVVRRVVLQ
jgi:hypothetical protein